jgi:hypothetical protein
LGFFDERVSWCARHPAGRAAPNSNCDSAFIHRTKVIAGWIPQKIEVFWFTLIGLPESREVSGRTSPNTGRKPPRSSETALFKIHKLLR